MLLVVELVRMRVRQPVGLGVMLQVSAGELVVDQLLVDGGHDVMRLLGLYGRLGEVGSRRLLSDKGGTLGNGSMFL